MDRQALKQLLIAAGIVNGLILPMGLAIILIAAKNRTLMKGYRHPVWMQLSGWAVVIVMGIMGAKAIAGDLPKLWK